MATQQQIVTVRASAKGLQKALSSYLDDGWRIVSTSKGGEITRILHTYQWTVVLEKDV